MGIMQMIAAAGGLNQYLIDKSLRFNDDDSAHLTWTPSTTGNRQKWTWSGWVKRSILGTYQTLFGTNYAAGNSGTFIRFNSDDALNFGDQLQYQMITSAFFMDPAAWYHIVLAVDTTQNTSTDRYKLYVNGSQITDFSTGTYPAQNHSHELNNTEEHALGYDTNSTNAYFLDGYMAEVNFIDGQAKTAADFGETNADTGQWIPKEYSGSYGTNGFYLKLNGTDLGEDSSGNDNDWKVLALRGPAPDSVTPPKCYKTGTTLYTNAADIVANGTLIGTDGIGGAAVSGEYCYIVHGDSGIDGEKVFSAGWSASIYGYRYEPDSTWYNTGGYNSTSPSEWTTWEYTYDGTESSYDIDKNHGTGFTFLAGSSYSVPDVWTGTYPTLDASNFNTLSGLQQASDVLTDSPTNYGDTDTGVGGEVGGNYCTFSPLCITGSANSLKQGNLKATHAVSTGWLGGLGTNGATFIGTIGMTSGKWYFEVTQTGGTAGPIIGITPVVDGPYYVGYAGNGIGYASGAYYNTDWPMPSTPATPSSFTTDDVIGVAVDMDNGFVWFSKNGTWQDSGDPTSTNAASNGAYGDGFVGETMFPAATQNGGSDDMEVTANFGQRPFAYTAPSGFKCLCTQNLPVPAVQDPSNHFDIKLYTGTEADLTVSGYNFAPDFVWRKGRQAISGPITETAHHLLFDTVRGAGKRLNSNNNTIEDTGSNTLKTFNSDGFTLGDSTDGNDNPQTYAAWAWNAGSSNTSVSAGDLNSSAYNISSWVADTDTSNGAIWPGASLTTILNGQAGGSFHGDHNVSPSSLIFQWSSGTISGNVRLKLRTYGTAAHTYKVAGNATPISITVPTLSTFDWYDLGNIDLVEYEATCPSSGNAAAIEAFELDGKILVDSGQTPADVPTIDSTYRANPSAGFSIVSYTGNRTARTQVAHGLNAKADFILFKNRTQTDNWGVYHKELGPEKYMYLSTDSVVGDDAGFFSDTDGNSNCFIVGDEDTVNGTSETMIAYCWSEVPGFSKFSNYTGSQSYLGSAGGSEGPFIYCGFTPRWLLLKQAEASYNGSWLIYDTARTPTNSGENWIYANTYATEAIGASYSVTVTSTGFKVRSTSAENNGTGRNYIFAAFAESPLKYANAR